MGTQNNITKYLLLKTVGILFCTIPPFAAILSYFPVWCAKGGEYVFSGFTLLLIALAFMPLYRGFKRLLQSSASYTLWLVLFGAFFILSKIADEMTVISFVGFIGNSIGAVFFKLADRFKAVDDI